MGRIRNIGVALMLASVMAMGFGTTLSAASKPGGGGGGGKGNGKGGSVCEYLTAIINYDYTSPTVMVYTLSLYSYYSCGE